MSTTRLSDIVIPENYSKYDIEKAIELNNLFQSGVIVTSPMLQALAGSGGQTVNIPQWLDVTKDEPNTSSDDPAVFAVPKKQTAVKQVARIASLNQSWSSTDLAVELAGSDGLQAVMTKTNQYWAEQLQRRLIASITGIAADSIANHSSDLINDQTGFAFNASAFIDTAQTMGDHKSKLRAFVVHSEMQALMSKLNLIEYLRDEDTNLTYPTYKGLQLLEDDQCANDGTTFDCYLVGSGAFASAAGNPKEPLEVERQALAANGGGVETLVSRLSPIVHPAGYAWVEGTISGDSPNLAELRLAEHWNRVTSSRKLVPLAVYRCDLVDV